MILSISGVPGAGKSTVAHLLAHQIGATVVAWDDFETMTHRDPDQIAEWIARGAPFDEIEAPGLVDRLQRTEGTVIFDGLLGPAWTPVAPLISHAIWLDCPLDIALSRKVAQMLREVGPDWVVGYLNEYSHIVAPALRIQMTKVPGLCSFKIDATKSPKMAIAEIRQRFFSGR